MGIYKRGETWWMSFSYNAKQMRTSCETGNKKLAEQIYYKTITQITEGKFLEIQARDTNFEDMCDDLIADYKMNKRKSTDRAQRSINHLMRFFARMKAREITSDLIKHYYLKRQEEKADNGTINRELAALKRMFNIAYNATPPKVVNVPCIPHLKENPPRKGFFEHSEHIALMKYLPDYLKSVESMYYDTGMRREEILGLKWPQIDVETGRIELEAGTTKNGEPRIIYIDGELLDLIRMQKSLRDGNFPVCPWVFFNHKTGKQIRDFRCAWKTACKKAGIKSGKNIPGGKIPHDFRRTAVRNMVRAGIPDKVAMEVSGHKTRSIFDRYNIVDERDVKDAARKLQRHVYHNSITIEETTEDSSSKTITQLSTDSSTIASG